MTEAWEPDEQLVPAALARKLAMSDLSVPDRCWVVAGLTLHGLTAEDTAERLGCSLRLVRTIRADPLTRVCVWAQREASAFADELRLSRSEHRIASLSLTAATDEVGRLRGQIARLIGTRPEVTCYRGHDMTDRYNRYERRGRVWCRECHRERQAAYRARRRVHSVAIDSAP